MPPSPLPQAHSLTHFGTMTRHDLNRLNAQLAYAPPVVVNQDHPPGGRRSFEPVPFWVGYKVPDADLYHLKPSPFNPPSPSKHTRFVSAHELATQFSMRPNTRPVSESDIVLDCLAKGMPVFVVPKGQPPGSNPLEVPKFSVCGTLDKGKFFLLKPFGPHAKLDSTPDLIPVQHFTHEYTVLRAKHYTA
jgi:hypothetical protein